ncbi:expressed unknown protein [Seminavis robusta]|uniref:Uncharacterized protein n=1 Tax=Seminavis robusta TaxID=568900 RepID=A0A9N8HW22_9STRA|nr:expressed unknown protein [Seminavis robusta]|eukprot:Sro2061_g312980.1 n/a (215) ;mRNA; r:9864-10508
MDSSLSSLIIVLALIAHLVAVYLGYRFHLWMLDKHTQEEPFNFGTWWNQQTNATFKSKTPEKNNIASCGEGTVDPENLSNSQVAFLQTLSIWLLVVGMVARWRFEIVLLVLAGVILLARQYPGGMVPDSHIYIAIFGYIAWLAILTTTLSLLLWPIHAYHWDASHGYFYRTVSIGGAISFSAAAALALIAFCLHKPQVAQDTGNCMESTFHAMT